MKKLITLTLMMILCSAMSYAQNKVEFTDKDGNVIKNGSVIEALGAIDEWEGEIEQQSGIFVKNMTDETVNFTVKVHYKKAVEGFNVLCCGTGACFPMTAGKEISGDIEIEGKATHDMDTHVTYNLGVKGTAEMDFTLSEGGKEVSKITVKFTAKDATGIENIAADALCNIYDITGKLVKANVNRNAVKSLNKGLYLVRELTGAKNVNKVVIK